MRCFIIFFIGLLASPSGFSQNYIPYYNLISKAEFDIYNGDYEAALEKINEAFVLEEPLAKDCYLLAFCLDQADPEANRLEVDRWLLYGSTKPGFMMKWFETAPLQNDFDEPFMLSLWDNVANTQSELKPTTDTLNYFRAQNPELSRVFADSISVHYDSDDEIFQKLLAELNRHDSLMQVAFLGFVKENGYPGMNISGTNLAQGMLRNLSETLFEEYKIVLLDAIERGEIDPWVYGTMVDGHNCLFNGEAFYLAQKVNPSCMPPKVEILENRRKIGMSPYFRGPRQYLWIGERWLLEIPD